MCNNLNGLHAHLTTLKMTQRALGSLLKIHKAFDKPFIQNYNPKEDFLRHTQ